MQEGFFPKNVTKEQAKDTGMAMVLICMLIAFLADRPFFFKLALPILVINMIWPGVYRPAAKVWLGLSTLLGSVVSKIVLSLVFFLIITPIGILRKTFRFDSLLLKQWKKGSESTFKVRDHPFSGEDLDQPY